MLLCHSRHLRHLRRRCRRRRRRRAVSVPSLAAAAALACALGLLTPADAAPERPRVLILGDSISIGYTPYVRELLADRAEVVRPMRDARRPENCQGTTYGVKRIDRWLAIGGGRWDVIHFNFGLHDLKRVDPDTGRPSSDPSHPRQAPPEVYERQLRRIVERLEKTGAALIFATTTPVPPGGVRPHRDVEDPARYNRIARAIMKKHGVAIDDLYAFALPRLAEIQRKVNVHFTAAGSKLLAGEVARHIRAALDARKGRAAGGRIRPWKRDPTRWEHRGKPVLLIGGSDDDNLFQYPDLEKHLDEIARAGGNYIRNTMSDRRDRGSEVYPFKRLPDGKYDLEQWNEEYWRRFENLLRWTDERGIVVQIEVWDRFDYSDSGGSTRWIDHPYNPKNNVNYTTAESGLRETYRKHPGTNEQPFFFTVPALRNNTVVLRYQVRQVEKLLSYSLPYGHVLYCIDNETSGAPEWGRFWAQLIRDRAAARGVDVYVTEMWDQWNPRGEEHRRTLDHPEVYSFVDISQNNHNRGQKHWDGLQWVRRYTAARPRPINCVKIYGADTGRFGTTRDGEERFWRNIFGGAASSRFHRPPSGLGLGERARRHLRAMRMLLAELDIFRCAPDVDSHLLSSRDPDEAYLTFEPGRQYAVYFPDGGSVGLDLSGAAGALRLRWLDVAAGAWGKDRAVTGGGRVALEAPGRGHRVCLIRR